MLHSEGTGLCLSCVQATQPSSCPWSLKTLPNVHPITGLKSIVGHACHACQISLVCTLRPEVTEPMPQAMPASLPSAYGDYEAHALSHS